MKRCLACGSSYETKEWTCPACGSEPQRLGRWLAFAPALAVDNDGMSQIAHHTLNTLQEKSFWFRSRNKLIVELIQRYGRRDGKLLEIGCGTGFVLKGLRDAFPSATLWGSEIYGYALDYAASRLGPDITLLQMDARHLPFVEDFDAICAFDVVEHIDEDEAVLKEALRALKPGGYFFASVPQHPVLWSKTDEIAHHKRRYRRGELEKKLFQCGFFVEFTSSFVFSLLPVMLVQRIVMTRRKSHDVQSEFMLPQALDIAFERLLDIERGWIRSRRTFPIGGSRFVVARRPI